MSGMDEIIRRTSQLRTNTYLIEPATLDTLNAFVKALFDDGVPSDAPIDIEQDGPQLRISVAWEEVPTFRSNVSSNPDS
jgi:hypothetical protein